MGDEGDKLRDKFVFLLETLPGKVAFWEIGAGCGLGVVIKVQSWAFCIHSTLGVVLFWL